MKKSLEWIDEAKAKLGIESDYAMAKKLGITRSAMSGYRNKKITISEDVAMDVADILEVDPAIVLIATQAERTKRPEIIEIMDNFLKRAGSAAAAIILAVSVGWVPSPVEAGHHANCGERAERSILC